MKLVRLNFAYIKRLTGAETCQSRGGRNHSDSGFLANHSLKLRAILLLIFKKAHISGYGAKPDDGTLTTYNQQ